jgi:hypothetical protein
MTWIERAKSYCGLVRGGRADTHDTHRSGAEALEAACRAADSVAPQGKTAGSLDRGAASSRGAIARPVPVRRGRTCCIGHPFTSRRSTAQLSACAESSAPERGGKLRAVPAAKRTPATGGRVAGNAVGPLRTSRAEAPVPGRRPYTGPGRDESLSCRSKAAARCSRNRRARGTSRHVTRR